MPFIGIIADENRKNYIRNKLLKNLNMKETNILFIKEKSIENIKNIKFETILLARKFSNIEKLKKLLINSKYLVVNTDIKNNLNVLKDLDLNLITYGFNSKATITISSISEDIVLVCIQRNIENINKKMVEIQEIKLIKDEEYISEMMAIEAILLIYSKNNF